MKTAIYYLGPRQLHTRLTFKYQDNALIRHLDQPSVLLDQLALDEFQNYIVVIKPEFEQQIKQVLKSAPKDKDCKVYIDRFDDSHKIQIREFVIGDTFQQPQLDKKIKLDSIKDLPTEVLSPGPVFAKIYAPQTMKQELSQLEKKNNIAVYLYKEQELKNYFIGVQRPQGLPPNTVFLDSPQQLASVQEIHKYCNMNIYCKKQLEEPVLQLLKSYKGHKKVIVSRETKKLATVSMIEQNQFQSKRQRHKQVLILLTPLDQDSHQDFLKKQFSNYKYYKIRSTKQLQNIQELKEPQTQSLFASYRKQKDQLQAAVSTVQSKNRSFIYYDQQPKQPTKDSVKQSTAKKRSVQASFARIEAKTDPTQAPKKRVVIFVSGQKQDPNLRSIQQKYRDWPFKQIGQIGQIGTVKQVNEKDCQVIVIGYQSKKQQITKSTNSFQKQLVFLPDKAPLLRRRIVAQETSEASIFKLRYSQASFQVCAEKLLQTVKLNSIQASFEKKQLPKPVQQQPVKLNSIQASFEKKELPKPEEKKQGPTSKLRSVQANFEKNNISEKQKSPNKLAPAVNLRAIQSSFSNVPEPQKPIFKRRAIQASFQHIKQPIKQHIKQPTKQPIKEPVKQPTKQLTKQPVKQPIKQPVKELAKIINLRHIQASFSLIPQSKKLKETLAQPATIDPKTQSISSPIKVQPNLSNKGQNLTNQKASSPEKKQKKQQKSEKKRAIESSFQKIKPQVVKESIPKEPEQYFIKPINRKKSNRLRILALGNTPMVSQAVKELQSKHPKQCICKQFSSMDKLKADLNSQLPTIVILDSKDKQQAVPLFKKNQSNQSMQFFIFSKSPTAQKQLFSEHPRVAVLSHIQQPLVDEVSNYLDEPVQQHPIIKEDRRRQNARLRVYYPQQNQEHYLPLRDKQSDNIELKPYKEVSQLDLAKLAKQPSFVILREKDRGKLSKVVSDKVFITQMCQFPSQNQSLFKNPRISVVSHQHPPVSAQIQNYIGSQTENPLIRMPNQKYYSMTVANYNPDMYRPLDQLHQSIKQAYPDLKYSKPKSLQDIKELPVVILCEDKRTKEVSSFIKNNRGMHQIILTPAPSELKEKWERQPSISAVSNKKQPIVAQIAQFIKPEESLSSPAEEKANKLRVLLVDEPQAEVKSWRLLQSTHPDRLQVQQLRSLQQLKKKDLLLKPTLVVSDISNKGEVLSQLKSQRNNNNLLYAMFRTPKPSQHAKLIQNQSIVKAVSHEPNFLQQHSLKLLNKEPISKTPLLKAQNRKEFKKGTIVWQDDGSQESEKALQEVKNKFGKYTKLVVVKNLKQLEQQDLDKPTFVVHDLKNFRQMDAVFESQKNTGLPLYSFVYGKNPVDRKLLFSKNRKVSMMSQRPSEISEQLRHYVKFYNDQDLLKQLQRKKLQKPLVLFLNFQGSRFEQQGAEVQQSLPEYVQRSHITQKQKFPGQSQILLVTHEDDAKNAAKFCKQYAYNNHFRTFMLTKDPDQQSQRFYSMKRFVCAAKSPQTVADELRHYYHGPQSREATANRHAYSVQVKNDYLSKDFQQSLQNRFRYLKKRTGKLVWNMDQHHRELNDRAKSLLKKPTSQKIKYFNPAYIYL